MQLHAGARLEISLLSEKVGQAQNVFGGRGPLGVSLKSQQAAAPLCQDLPLPAFHLGLHPPTRAERREQTPLG